METWLRISLLLCIFGAIKEFRPSEPFVTPYLVGPWKNFTGEQVNQDIFPIGTYACLAELIVVFLVTDLLRYKPVIILEGIAGITTWCLLIWGKSVLTMQIMEVCYGLFIATEVAYYTYIYAQVDREHYQIVTSHTRAAYLCGRCMSGVVSQLLVSYDVMDYYQLNFISFGALIIATFWAVSLPSAKHSLYFHREEPVENNTDGIDNIAAEPLAYKESVLDAGEPKIENVNVLGNRQLSFTDRWKRAYYYLWKDFKMAYTNLYVVKWSFWWALATCGYLQTLNYIQLIWEEIIKDNHQTSAQYRLYNGAVEAIYTIIGAGTALACGWLRLNWQLVGEASLAICSVIEGVLLVVSTVTISMPVAYVCYVLFGVIYYTMITVANSEVAKHLTEDSYGLIFGINTFIALALQSLLTAIAVTAMDLEIRTQFHVYGGYFAVLGVIFACMAIYTLCTKGVNKQQLWLPKELQPSQKDNSP